MPNRFAIYKALRDNFLTLAGIVVISGVIYGYGALNAKVETLDKAMVVNGEQHEKISSKLDVVNANLSKVLGKLGMGETAFCPECNKLAMSCNKCK